MNKQTLTRSEFRAQFFAVMRSMTLKFLDNRHTPDPETLAVDAAAVMVDAVINQLYTGYFAQMEEAQRADHGGVWPVVFASPASLEHTAAAALEKRALLSVVPSAHCDCIHFDMATGICLECGKPFAESERGAVTADALVIFIMGACFGLMIANLMMEVLL